MKNENSMEEKSKMTFAYLIPAHKNPQQLLRLVKNLLSDNVFVFIHIDRKVDEDPYKASLSSYGNVFFCNHRIRVNWGGFSQIEATVALIRTMIVNIGIPNYVHLISGQDFPLKNPDQMEDFFKRNSGRNFIEYESLPKSDWHLGGMDRIEKKWYIDSMGMERAKELLPYQKSVQFIPNIIPYGGSSWWSLTGNCIVWLFEQCSDGNEIYDRFKDTLCPDELLFQTLLMHSPFKDSIVNSNLRKIDWPIPGPHPHIWLYNDIEILKETPKLFARKLDENMDNRVIEELETFVLQSPKKKDRPAISVVMSMYNAEKYVAECIESVLSQTFDDFEFIIVDDGSEDSSVRIVESFHDSRIKLIKNKHDFIDSLNQGMSAAKGEFIARMDADDMIFPEKLEMQYDYMISHPQIDVCVAWAECFGLYVKILKSPAEHNSIVSGLLFGNFIINPSALIRSKSIQKNAIVYKNYFYAEDYKFWTDCAEAGLKFASIPKVLVKCRKSTGQVTSKHFDEMMQTSDRIILEYAQFVASSIVEKDEAYTDLIDTLIESANNDLIESRLFLNVLYGIKMKLMC